MHCKMVPDDNKILGNVLENMDDFYFPFQSKLESKIHNINLVAVVGWIYASILSSKVVFQVIVKSKIK